MCNQNEWIVREAFRAYQCGDIARMMEFVDPDLDWTNVDPGDELEQVLAHGEKVVLVMWAPGTPKAPGPDRYRPWRADGRTYDVATVRDGVIVALHACRDRGEARSLAGLA